MMSSTGCCGTSTSSCRAAPEAVRGSGQIGGQVKTWIQYHDIEATPQTHAIAREEKGAFSAVLRIGEMEILDTEPQSTSLEAARVRAEGMLSERGHECGRCDPRWHPSG